MTEVIHEQVASDSSASLTMFFMLGLILLIVFGAILFFFFGVGKNFGSYSQTPAPQTQTAPEVKVPGKIDVNINK